MSNQKIRAYPLANHANDTKLAQLRELLGPWRDALCGMQSQLLRAILNGQPLTKRMSTKTSDLSFTTILSARQIKSVYNQTFAALESWQKLLQSRVRELITGSSLEADIKTILYRVNKRLGWYSKTFKLPMLVNNLTGEIKHSGDKPSKDWIKEELEVPPALLKLLRHMVNHARRNGNAYPNLRRVNTLLLDGPIAMVEKANGESSFDYWVRISTLTHRKPVLIPIRANNYFNNASGQVANFVQLKFLPNNSLQFVLLKKSETAALRTTGKYLGLDWGMKSLFATSDGRLLGQGVMPHLQELDVQLLALEKALQAQNIPRKTNLRYQALHHRMREYIKNETNRILNELSHEDLVGLVVEKLNFRRAGLSKSMNRLLNRFGRSSVRKKLNTLTEDKGLTVTEVNPAYSSQECSGCGYISKKNRSRQKFLCRFCGKKTHADINAARVLVKRRSFDISKSSNTVLSRGSLRQKLDNNFQRYWRCSLPVDDANRNQADSSRCATVQLSRSV